jgi:secreted PhoX family phosphatase
MNEQDRIDDLEALDDQPVTRPGHGPALPRRSVLKGGLGAAVAGFFTAPLAGCGQSGSSPAMPLIGFSPLPPQTNMTFDRVHVPEGYSARVLYAWGDPIRQGAPAWQADGSNDWQQQMQQAGDNHDGMHFFPFDDSPNQRGLLVINHEKVALNFLHPQGPTFTRDANGRRQRPEAEVKKEQAAHGVSVIEVRRSEDGQWQREMDSRYNRRITGMTAMALRGPAAGTDALKTASDPQGTTVLGTIANCAMGFTPWGTYLTCEENWPNYFVNRDQHDYRQRVAHQRYRLSQGDNSKYFAWESVDLRFDATPYPEQPHGGHVNEPNRFGWVVEIDPFDPHSTPIKRTAMGRLVRECATPSVGPDGRMAFYFGDDTRGEYIYKFVPAGRYQPDNRAANRHLLDEGALYVRRQGQRAVEAAGFRGRAAH